MSHVAPMRTLNRPKPTVDVERRPDGSLILTAGRTLPDDLPLVIDLLGRAAERRPHVTFLAERRGPDRAWQRLTYAEAWARTGAIASWLIAQGYGPDSRPLAILSDNSLEHALLLHPPGEGTLSVIDAAGREVRRLATSGGAVTWDGRDASGLASPAGVYWVRFNGGAGTAIRRVVKLGR